MGFGASSKGAIAEEGSTWLDVGTSLALLLIFVFLSFDFFSGSIISGADCSSFPTSPSSMGSGQRRTSSSDSLISGSFWAGKFAEGCFGLRPRLVLSAEVEIAR